VKAARIYEELAGVARAAGYPFVTGAVVHDWRKRDLLPKASGLTRRAHSPSELPGDLVERVLAICRYRYDRDLRDLPGIGLLLWLDGEAIEPRAIQLGFESVRSLPARLVASAGSRARAADPHDPDADIDATATAMERGRALFEEISGETVDVGDIGPGAVDVLGVALARGSVKDTDPEAVARLAKGMGFERAATEKMFGASPWLEGKSIGAELNNAISHSFGSLANEENQEIRPDQFEQIRDIANELVPIFQTFGEMLAIGFLRGTVGFGFLAANVQYPERIRILIAYSVARNPDPARKLADALADIPLDEWRDALESARKLVENSPEIQAEIGSKGLIQILEERAQKGDN
jgi:hypothetical protein